MGWQKHVARHIMQISGNFPGVQLHLLLKRLEQYPETQPATATATQDMETWCLALQAHQEAENRRRTCANECRPLNT